MILKKERLTERYDLTMPALMRREQELQERQQKATSRLFYATPAVNMKKLSSGAGFERANKGTWCFSQMFEVMLKCLSSEPILNYSTPLRCEHEKYPKLTQ